MVGEQNRVGVDTDRLRRLASGKEFYTVMRDYLGRLCDTPSDYVINLNFHPAVAALAESIPASRHGGARWRDVIGGVPSDTVFRELFLHSAGKERVTSRHLSEIWGGYCEPAGSRADLNPPYHLSLPAPARNSAVELLRSRADSSPPYRQEDRPVAIIVGAGLDVRACSAAYWTEFIKELTVDAPVILIGSQTEQSRGEQIVDSLTRLNTPVVNFCGKTDPAGLAGLLFQCRLAIGTDSGPLHVAAMVGTKCLGLYYGSMFFRQTGPYGPSHTVIAPDQPGYPCSEEEMTSFPAKFTPPSPRFAAEIASAILSGEDRHSCLSISDGRIGVPNGWRVLKSSSGRNGLHWNRIEGSHDVPRSIDIASRHSNIYRGEGRHSVAHLKDGDIMSTLPDTNIIAVTSH